MKAKGLSVFLVGCERSGTTLLRLMLNAHPSVEIPTESHFIADLIDKFGFNSNLDDTETEGAISIITSHQRWKDWGLSKHELRDRVLALENPNIIDIVNLAFAQKLENGAASHWGDKTPRYSNYIPALESMFPLSKFIHITRDGRDVCLSFLKTNWIGPWVSRIAPFWVNRVEAAHLSGSALKQGRYLHVKYEDLVSHTEETLNVICEFLDINYNPCMLHYEESLEDNVAGLVMKHHKKLKKRPEANDTNRWKNEMNISDLLVFEAFSHKTLDKFGYKTQFGKIGLLIYPLIRLGVKLLNSTSGIRKKIGLTSRNMGKAEKDSA